MTFIFQTIVFSRNAVVCQRDDEYYFLFRVGDMRRTHIIGTSIRALLVKHRQTREGETMPLCQYPLNVETESSRSDSFVFFFWPVTVAHKIDRSSPFWNMSAERMTSERFEVIVILEGTVQTSGSMIQVCTSYVPDEIRWGQRPTPLVTTETKDGILVIDYSKFHETTPMEMPEYSAACQARMRSVEGGKAPGERDNGDEDRDFLVCFSAPAVHFKTKIANTRKLMSDRIFPRNFHRHPAGCQKRSKIGKDLQRDEGASSQQVNIEGRTEKEVTTGKMLPKKNNGTKKLMWNKDLLVRFPDGKGKRNNIQPYFRSDSPIWAIKNNMSANENNRFAIESSM